jgi:hypothetical protein
MTGRNGYAGPRLVTSTDIATPLLAFPIGGKAHLLPFLSAPGRHWMALRPQSRAACGLGPA